MKSSTKALSRSGLIAGAAILILACGVMVWLRPRSTDLDRSLARGSGAQPGAKSARVVGAGSLALAALREGRFDQAIEFYRGLPATDWLADDCFALGSALFERDRIGLGRAALEAARRINDKHLATTAEINAFRHKQDASAGRQRALLQEEVGRVEPLQSVPGGPPLGLLVLALARYATTSNQEEEFFDLLRMRHAASLARLDEPRDAIKMIARLLLETGRAGEARDLLDPLLKARYAQSPAPAQAASDREAAWLMSRAALRLGTHETADAMLAVAGDFGKSAGGRLEPSPFVGSARCGECHRAIYRAQQGESRHAQTLRFGTDLKNVPLPSGSVADQAVAGITYRFNRKNDREIELQAQEDNQIFRAIIEYAVGSGRHGITMLARDEEGVERELRISYIGRDGSWGQSKGIDSAPQSAGDHIGFGMGRRAVHRCLSCHTTWSRAVDPDHAAAPPPEGKDRGIGCERCHGPGMNHVKAVESGFAELAIALTSRTPQAVRLNSCVECHADDGSISPSDPEFTRFQGTTFQYSRCFIASKDRFSCTTCHDPHGALETESSRYEAKCLVCHVSAPGHGPAEHASASSAPGLSAATGKACPVNPTTNCISCHMPKVDDPSHHARFTDHHIRVGGRVSPSGKSRPSQ